MKTKGMSESEIIGVYLRQQKWVGNHAHRRRWVALADRVLALREHEREIPIDTYLVELDRIRGEVGKL